MDTFPKSFRWAANPDDVITFTGPNDVPVCSGGHRWYWPGILHVVSANRWIPVQRDATDTELTALRTFHDAIMSASQLASTNDMHRAILAADDELRRVVPKQVAAE